MTRENDRRSSARGVCTDYGVELPASTRPWRPHWPQTVEALFGASVVIAIIYVALGGPEGWGQYLVSLLAFSVPACAATLVGYITQGEYLRNSLRCGRTADSLRGDAGG